MVQEDFQVAFGALAHWSAAAGDYVQAAHYEIRGLDATQATKARKVLATQGVEAYWTWQTTRAQAPIWASTYAARIGDLDNAFGYLEQTVASREPELTVVVRHPDRFPSAMVRDPRWKRTMAPVGIPSVDPADVMMPWG